jgi:hypothetical protein
MDMFRLLALLGFLLAPLGCSQDPSRTSCEDLPCLQQQVVRRWETQPEQVAQELAQLDELTQEALVLALAEAHPASIATLCQALPPGAGAERCRRLSQRPHLLGGGGQGAGKRRGTPGLVDHTGIELVPSPWGSMEPSDLGCDARLDDCWFDPMLAAAATGQVEPVGGVCNAIPTERFQRECYFRAAEALAVAGGAARPEHTELASELCLGAGPYAKHCVRELARAIARGAPAADQADPEAWRRSVQAVQGMHRGLARHDPRVADLVADRAWTELVWASFQQAEHLNGLALEQLPEPAAPQVRATAIWLLMKREARDTPQRDLDAWVDRATQLLADRRPSPARGSSGAKARPAAKSWSSIDPVSTDGPWVHYLGESYRPLFADPELDLVACVLEAAARQGLPELLEAATAHPEPTIAAHARTLQRRSRPEGPRPAGG